MTQRDESGDGIPAPCAACGTAPPDGTSCACFTSRRRVGRVLTITLLLDGDRPIEDCEAAARSIFEAAFNEPIVTAGDYKIEDDS